MSTKTTAAGGERVGDLIILSWIGFWLCIYPRSRAICLGLLAKLVCLPIRLEHFWMKWVNVKLECVSGKLDHFSLRALKALIDDQTDRQTLDRGQRNRPHAHLTPTSRQWFTGLRTPFLRSMYLRLRELQSKCLSQIYHTSGLSWRNSA